MVFTAGLLIAAVAAAGAQPKETPAAHPSVEVVFVLDTTGSMGGLIEGAKQRIWAIANEIAKGRPSPKVKMGLVAYRDKGDDYVTKVFDLSDNLDRTYADLMTLRAGGGGDGPEHVIAALSDAVDKVSWSTDPKAFKVIYLVGDAPPHEDYADAPQLAAVMEKAVRRGLIVNAAPCGSDASMMAAFERVARSGEGRLLPVPQDGGMVAVATPFDAPLAELSGKLEDTGLAYGSGRAKAKKDMSLAAAVRGMAAAPAAAERAVFKTRAGFSAESDLASAVAERRVELKDIKEEELPDSLKGLSAPERRARLDKIVAERGVIRAQVVELSRKREAWLKKESGARKTDSFDARLVESLKSQAARKGIAY